MENSSYGKCGKFSNEQLRTSLYWYLKGNYNILHSTIATYWNLNGALPGYGIYATNEYANGATTELGALNLIKKFYCLF